MKTLKITVQVADLLGFVSGDFDTQTYCEDIRQFIVTQFPEHEVEVVAATELSGAQATINTWGDTPDEDAECAGDSEVREWLPYATEQALKNQNQG